MGMAYNLYWCSKTLTTERWDGACIGHHAKPCPDCGGRRGIGLHASAHQPAPSPGMAYNLYWCSKTLTTERWDGACIGHHAKPCPDCGGRRGIGLHASAHQPA